MAHLYKFVEKEKYLCEKILFICPLTNSLMHLPVTFFRKRSGVLNSIFLKDNNKIKYLSNVAESQFKSFNTIAATVYEHHEEILNFFINRSTNASAENFNAKIKSFRASLKGVIDIKFFLFRLTNIYA